MLIVKFGYKPMNWIPNELVYNHTIKFWTSSMENSWEVSKYGICLQGLVQVLQNSPNL